MAIAFETNTTNHTVYLIKYVNVFIVSLALGQSYYCICIITIKATLEDMDKTAGPQQATNNHRDVRIMYVCCRTYCLCVSRKSQYIQSTALDLNHEILNMTSIH